MPLAFLLNLPNESIILSVQKNASNNYGKLYIFGKLNV